MSELKVLGFAGSLRKGSHNRALLRAAVDLAPAGMSIETFDLEGMPAYNMDLEAAFPERPKEFKARIRAADALLIATPEHNYSVPGVLKNAIDWASRPHGDSAFAGKPVAIMSASTGMLGGARAQYHLRQVFVFLDMHPVNRPEVIVPTAAQKFDESGRLTDPKTREQVALLLKALADWTVRLRGTQQPNQ